MDNFKTSRLGNLYEYGGAIIIILVFFLFLAYGYKLVFQGKQEPTSVIVVRNHVPNYSVALQEIKKRNQSDSLLAVLLSEKENFVDSIQVLNRKIEEVNIDNSDTENKVKIVASIIAVIVAAVGFFGFKSLNDIREHTIKNSQIDAQKIAKDTAKSEAEEQVKEILVAYRSKVEELAPLIKEVEKGLGARIDALGNQLNELEEATSRLTNRVKVIEDKNEENGDNGDQEGAVKAGAQGVTGGNLDNADGENGNKAEEDMKAVTPRTTDTNDNSVDTSNEKKDKNDDDTDQNIFK